MRSRLHLSTTVVLGIALLLAGCAGPRATKTTASSGDAAFTRVSSLARAAYDQGSLAQAETLYRQALRRAQSLDAIEELANASYNLAAVLIARGQVEDARALLDEAETESRRAGLPLTDIWLVKAQLDAADNQSDKALRWIEAVNTSASANPAQRAEAALLHGEIAFATNDVVQARTQLEAVRQWTQDPSPLQAAGIEKLSGLIALLENRPAEAAAAFDREADYYRKANKEPAMAHAMGRAGEAHAAAGEMHAAEERLYRAARSFYAQGNVPAAQSLLARARQTASRLGDPALTQRVERLAAEIEQAQR